MKTHVIKVVSSNPELKSGVIHLTENQMGNICIEGSYLQSLSRTIKAYVIAAIDMCLVGFEEQNQHKGIHVTVV